MRDSSRGVYAVRVPWKKYEAEDSNLSYRDMLPVLHLRRKRQIQRALSLHGDDLAYGGVRIRQSRIYRRTWKKDPRQLVARAFSKTRRAYAMRWRWTSRRKFITNNIKLQPLQYPEGVIFEPFIESINRYAQRPHHAWLGKDLTKT